MSTESTMPEKGFWARFVDWFRGLKVAQKLALISIFFIMPDSLMLYFFITGINANIEFARQEMKGNEYQRPLQKLLEYIPQHDLLAMDTTTEGAARLSRVAAQINETFDKLEEVDERIGKDLQFTDEGLAKRHREHYRVETLRGEWLDLKRKLPEMDHGTLHEAHLHLVDDIRMMITHAGDLSNLILDPDLDSYYIMDATLLVLPQNQDRLSRVMMRGYELLQKPTISDWDRQQVAISASFLKEADMDRIVASLQTALNEDANFYDVSPTLQARLPDAIAKYKSKAEKFIKRTQGLAGVSAKTKAEDYMAAGAEALAASFHLSDVAMNEMDGLLRTRMAYYEWRRTRSLLVAALAACAAYGFVTFITRSISGPLRAQALDLQKTNDALEAEITERNRAEAELRRSEEHLAAAQEIAQIGSWDWDIVWQKMSWSKEYYRIHGFPSGEKVETYEKALASVHPADREVTATAFAEALADGKSFSFEQRIVRRDGSERVLQQRGEVLRNKNGAVIEIYGTAQDITERKLAEARLEKTHQELMKVSRQAGMADVATGVLHNVGNVLNSVNVSASLITDHLNKSRVSHLANVCKMMQQQNGNLGNFLTTDPQGSKLPTFLYKLSDRLIQEQSELLQETEGLSKNITHIKDIVAVQQNYAKVSGVVEVVSASSLTEDALEMNFAGLNRHGVEVVREFQDMPPVRVDKHKVLQILVNIIGNAKYAVSESNKKSKKIVVKIARNADDNVQIQVIDNGIGIAPENLSRIFAHGFTTKKNGHGFGLHSAALAAKEIGGSLSVDSAGRGKGATFTLELPVNQAETKPAVATKTPRRATAKNRV